jgi:hypothetical protein
MVDSLFVLTRVDEMVGMLNFHEIRFVEQGEHIC